MMMTDKWTDREPLRGEEEEEGLKERRSKVTLYHTMYAPDCYHYHTK